MGVFAQSRLSSVLLKLMMCQPFHFILFFFYKFWFCLNTFRKEMSGKIIWFIIIYCEILGFFLIKYCIVSIHITDVCKIPVCLKCE